MIRRRVLVSGFSLALAAAPAVADAAQKGDLLQTDNLGMNVYSHDFTSDTTKTVGDAQKLSEFVGMHYYVADSIRVGMNLQFTEQLASAPAGGKSRFQTFALLPQVGWNFFDPFFAAVIFTLAPRTGGESKLDLGFQLLLGASLAISDRVRANVALEVPWNFYIHQTLGLTPLAGLSIRL